MANKINLEALIAEHLKSRLGGATRTAPSTDDYYRYLTGQINENENEKMIRFLAGSPEDQQFVLSLKRMQEEAESSITVPDSLLSKAKALQVSRKAAPQNLLIVLWLILAIVSFGLSFVFKRYFFQCLAVALFFGFKWALDLRAAKTKIMMYRALDKER